MRPRQSEEMEQAKRGSARRRVQSVQCPRSGQDQQCRQPNEDRDLTLEPTSQVISDFIENYLVETGTTVCLQGISDGTGDEFRRTNMENYLGQNTQRSRHGAVKGTGLMMVWKIRNNSLSGCVGAELTEGKHSKSGSTI